MIPNTTKLLKLVDGHICLSTNYNQISTFQKCPLKWYETYVMGKEIELDKEFISFGNVLMQVLGMYFKDGCRADGALLSEWFNIFSSKYPISWKDEVSMMRNGLMAGKMFCRFIDNMNGDISTLSTIDKLFKMSKPIGIKEKFDIKYTLPKPFAVIDRIYTEINISGSIDLHTEFHDNSYLVKYILR